MKLKIYHTERHDNSTTTEYSRNSPFSAIGFEEAVHEIYKAGGFSRISIKFERYFIPWHKINFIEQIDEG